MPSSLNGHRDQANRQRAAAQLLNSSESKGQLKSCASESSFESEATTATIGAGSGNKKRGPNIKAEPGTSKNRQRESTNSFGADETPQENQRVAYIVGGATALIFLSAFILIAVTLKMTPEIDEKYKSRAPSRT